MFGDMHGMISPSVIYLTHTLYSPLNNNLALSWHNWQQTGEATENRATAIQRLIYTVLNCSSYLDLSSLHLSDLPVLPSGITTLILDDNVLTCLPPSLPESLHKLSIARNRLLKLTTPLPQTLNYLNICDNRDCHIAIPCPLNLHKLVLSPEQLPQLPADWSVQLPRQLTIYSGKVACCDNSINNFITLHLQRMIKTLYNVRIN